MDALGEVTEGKGNIRRTGIFWGHWAYLNYLEVLNSPVVKGKSRASPGTRAV